MGSVEIQNMDSRRDIVIPGSKEEAVLFSVEHLIEAGKAAIEKRGAFYLALSGGSTPKAIFETLSRNSYRGQLDWKRVYLFWSDERVVPPDHIDSNYKMAMDAGLRDLPIPQSQIFRMKGEIDPETAAHEYEQQVIEAVPDQAFDLVMLGMGEDGHTASLFPKTHALHSDGRLVVANFLPDKDLWRLTMTYKCINQARNIAVYVLGEGKAKMVKKVLGPSGDWESYPVQHVGTEKHRALFVLDAGSASLIG